MTGTHRCYKTLHVLENMKIETPLNEYSIFLNVPAHFIIDICIFLVDLFLVKMPGLAF